MSRETGKKHRATMDDSLTGKGADSSSNSKVVITLGTVETVNLNSGDFNKFCMDDWIVLVLMVTIFLGC